MRACPSSNSSSVARPAARSAPFAPGARHISSGSRPRNVPVERERLLEVSTVRAILSSLTMLNGLRAELVQRLEQVDRALVLVVAAAVQRCQLGAELGPSSSRISASAARAPAGGRSVGRERGSEDRPGDSMRAARANAGTPPLRDGVDRLAERAEGVGAHAPIVLYAPTDGEAREGTHETTREKLEWLEELRDQSEHHGSEKAVAKHRGGEAARRERAEKLCDPDSFVELDRLRAPSLVELRDARAASLRDAVVTGYGTIFGRRVFVVSQDFTSSRLAERGLRREDLQGDGPGGEIRMPRDRHQRLGRCPDPGGCRLARRLRGDLLAQTCRAPA